MIDALVYSSLSGIEFLQNNLATYDSKPAIFFSEAPSDQDKAWGNTQFPRVDYYLDWTADSERKSAGTLFVSVWCQAGKQLIPEDFVDPITSKLTNRFYNNADGCYCTVWASNEPFQSGNEKPAVIGIELTFDIMAFPDQSTIEPDPVYGMEQFIKTNLADIVLLGTDEMGDSTTPSESGKPIIYIRTDNQSSSFRDLYAVRWIDVNLHIHIFADLITERNELARRILNLLVLAGECMLADLSPLFFQTARMDLSADPLRNGQIVVSGRYGVIIQVEESAPIQNIIFS